MFEFLSDLYACNGPEGTFYVHDRALAEQLISAAGWDRDDWTVTNLSDPGRVEKET